MLHIYWGELNSVLIPPTTTNDFSKYLTMKDNPNMYPTQRPLMHHVPSYKMENKAAVLPMSHLLRSH